MPSAHQSTAPAAETAPDWQPLPPRARGVMALNGALQLAIPGAVLGLVLGGVPASALDPSLAWSGRAAGVALALLTAAGLGAWLGLRRHRHTYWRHDAQGLALRRGRLWWRETRVPASRVQHLDVTRGPLQRSRDLATLVVHTAGTQHGTLKLANLDAADAERLRDALGRQIDHDDDA